MPENRWKWLKDTRCVQYDSSVRAIPPPSRDTVRRWEVKNQFQLPESYVDFICLLGPGEFTHTFTIAAPECAKYNSDLDLCEMNASMHRFNTEEDLREYHEHPDPILRSFAFGKTFGGD